VLKKIKQVTRDTVNLVSRPTAGCCHLVNLTSRS